MKKNTIFSSLNMAAVATAALLASACTANYLNINTNPYEVSKEQMEADGYGLGAALNGMAGGRWRRILFCGTGALLSPTSSQQGESIPSICHAVALDIGK